MIEGPRGFILVRRGEKEVFRAALAGFVPKKIAKLAKNGHFCPVLAKKKLALRTGQILHQLAPVRPPNGPPGGSSKV